MSHLAADDTTRAHTRANSPTDLSPTQINVTSENRRIKYTYIVGHGGSVVGSCHLSGGSQIRIPLQTPHRDIGKVLHSPSPVNSGMLIPTQYQCCNRERL